MENPILPDLVVAQSQHLQVFKLPDAARNFSEAIVVQQELAQRAVRSNKRELFYSVVAQVIVGQTQGPQAGPQVTEREGWDVTDAVVLEGQITKRARQVQRNGSEQVVRQIQGFQGPEEIQCIE